MNNKGVEAMTSLAVGDDLSLKLSNMLVFRRSDSADGAVHDITSVAKLNIGRDGFYQILQSFENLRTPCKVTEEATTMNSCFCGQDGIEW